LRSIDGIERERDFREDDELQSDGVTVQAAKEYDSFGNVIPNSASGNHFHFMHGKMGSKFA
jgi:hypothetical protein